MPETLKQRVVQVMAKDVAPALGMDGALLEVVSVEDGIAHIRLNGACGCCPSSVMTVVHGIEQELCKRVPEVEYVEVTP
jgi:Fe-S cluster biogenesis protein NfuA